MITEEQLQKWQEAAHGPEGHWEGFDPETALLLIAEVRQLWTDLADVKWTLREMTQARDNWRQSAMERQTGDLSYHVESVERENRVLKKALVTHLGILRAEEILATFKAWNGGRATDG